MTEWILHRQCMPQFDKLLTEVGPDDPPARAAHRALKSRLRAVLFYLDEAAADAGESAEGIHQLRIWTRRSGAALKLFGPLLPRKKGKKLKRTLRELRQTAGVVRDLDVLQAQLGSALNGTLSSRLSKERDAAQRDLVRLLRRVQKKGKLKRQIKRLLKKVRDMRRAESNGVAFAPWCRTQLVPLATDFARQAQRTAGRSDAALHQWRLATKRLRYALELAVAAIGKRDWTDTYELLCELQERLGVICDLLVQRERLKQLNRDMAPQDRTSLTELSRSTSRKLAKLKNQLARWWTDRRASQLSALTKQVPARR